MREKEYLVVFAHIYQDFRLPELLSVCEMNNMRIRHEEYSASHPFLIVSGGEDVVLAILDRCVLVQFIVEVWARCQTKEELFHFPFDGVGKVPGTFNILAHSFGRKFGMKERVEWIEQIEYLPLAGEVDCISPDQVYYICLNFLPQTDNPREVYFGPLVGRSCRASGIIDRYSVKKRLYIGRTSMDAELAFVMSNLAKIKNGDLVYDPFLGTGSLIISAAVHGAYVMGSDIDRKALNGWGKSTKRGEKTYQENQNVEGNMVSYALQGRYLGCFSSDFSCPLLRSSTPLFDVIVTDPPYGVREAALKVREGLRSDSQGGAGEICQSSLSLQFLELLNFAARTLVKGGRLVYWLPTIRSLYTTSHLPHHPALSLLHNAQQTLTSRTARRLLVLEKDREPEPGERAFFGEGLRDNSEIEQFRNVCFNVK